MGSDAMGSIGGKIVIPKDMIGKRRSRKLITPEQMNRLSANGYFEVKDAKTGDIIIGVRETNNSILLFTIKDDTYGSAILSILASSSAMPYSYMVNYCDKNGCQQWRAEPGDTTEPGSEDRSKFGRFYGLCWTAGALTEDQFKAIKDDPKSIMQILNYDIPALR